MVDRFGRVIDYLRVSVTDRCNLRCFYCMPRAGAEYTPAEERLSSDEIVEVVAEAVRIGVRKVRITGGEPLLRADLHRLIERIATIDGIDDLAMSTNGTLLAAHAARLKQAGLMRVNVSLDATDAERYARITGGGDVRDAFEGIAAASATGLAPIKINCVVRNSSSEPDALDVAEYARENGFAIRFIRRMDLSTGRFSVVEGGTGGDCSRCGRLRLLGDGTVRPCLFSDLGFSVRELGATHALSEAVAKKPEHGTHSKTKWMHTIGG